MGFRVLFHVITTEKQMPVKMDPKKKIKHLNKCFAESSDAKKQKIMESRKAPNTNKVTKLWVSCLTEYLEEKGHPSIELLSTTELAVILENFYSDIRSKQKVIDKLNASKEGQGDAEIRTEEDNECTYSQQLLEMYACHPQQIFQGKAWCQHNFK